MTSLFSLIYVKGDVLTTKTITVSIDLDSWMEAKKRRLNISGICSDAIINSVGRITGDTEKQLVEDNNLLSLLENERKAWPKAYIYACLSFSRNNNGLLPRVRDRREHGVEVLKYMAQWKEKHSKVSPVPPSKKELLDYKKKRKKIQKELLKKVEKDGD